MNSSLFLQQISHTFAFYRRRSAFIFGACLLILTLTHIPAWAAPEAPTKEQISSKKKDLKEIRGQIEGLRKSVSAEEEKRADALSQVKNIERSISNTLRDLRNLSNERSRVQSALAEISAQSKNLENRLSGEQKQMEQLIYFHYIQGKPDPLSVFLNGGDPNRLTRTIYYLSLVGQSRKQLQQDIEANLQHKRVLGKKMQERSAELATIEAQQKKEHEKLLAQHEQRKKILASIATKIADQRRTIGNLQRNEQNLSQLIAQLNKTIATNALPRKTTASKKPKRTEPNTPEDTTHIENTTLPEAQASSSFGQLKGELRLPVRGTLSNRFGSARQEGGTWKGLFIKAAQGTDIRSIAAGRVVFAEWMRGFGNLLIIDHGDGYLSIYGNNESLLKETGARVQGGDAIAMVGNSGGNPESGLYFELRHQGSPIDPLKWIKIK